MNPVALIKILIQKVEEYERGLTSGESVSYEGFVHSLTATADVEKLKNSLIGPSNANRPKSTSETPNSIERIISQHLIFMNRYVKFYSKWVFADSAIKSLEAFSFLITVMHHGRIGKTSLIRKNIMDKSAGIEIINRLIRLGLLAQVKNPNDQRSHLIELTETGQRELFGIFRNMETLGQIATGKLNASEKEQLASLLKKLDDFHYANYHKKSVKKLDEYLPEADR